MNTLKQFLKANPIEGITEDVIVSERLKDFTFKIKPITAKENSKISDESVTVTADRKVKTDVNRAMKKIITTCCIEPNFKSASDLEDMKCSTPDEYIDKCLLAGEQQNLYQAINKLSGFDKSFSELKDEIKN